jgi:hypothetical protein
MNNMDLQGMFARGKELILSTDNGGVQEITIDDYLEDEHGPYVRYRYTNDINNTIRDGIIKVYGNTIKLQINDENKEKELTVSEVINGGRRSASRRASRRGSRRLKRRKSRSRHHKINRR